MTRITKEKKLADQLANALDTLDFDFIHSAYAFTRYGSAVKRNLFELILAHLNQWAYLYDNGGVTKGDPMFTMCEMSSKMMKAIGP